jgi:hypothetical protein
VTFSCSAQSASDDGQIKMNAKAESKGFDCRGSTQRRRESQLSYRNTKEE